VEISAKDISFGYEETQPYLFNDLCLKISSPGFYSLFGFSGCGKSTLARLLAGLLKPQKGFVIKKGITNVLLCYNTERLPGWVSVGEHLDRAVSPKSSKKDLRYFISELGLSSVVDQKFFRLSMGQKNRANLARYLVQDFDMLICDEVLANVDEPSRNHILSLIKYRFGHHAILFYISHNVEEVCFFSKKIFVIPTGKETVEDLIEIDGLDGRDKKKEKGRQEILHETILKVLKAASYAYGQEI